MSPAGHRVFFAVMEEAPHRANHQLPNIRRNPFRSRQIDTPMP